VRKGFELKYNNYLNSGFGVFEKPITKIQVRRVLKKNLLGYLYH
jgi:hypothetical protein